MSEWENRGAAAAMGTSHIPGTETELAIPPPSASVPPIHHVCLRNIRRRNRWIYSIYPSKAAASKAGMEGGRKGGRERSKRLVGEFRIGKGNAAIIGADAGGREGEIHGPALTLRSCSRP